MIFIRLFCLAGAALLLAGCAGSHLAGRPATPADLRRAVGAPGVVQLRDSLFMDEAEVANLHWLEYLHFLRKDSSAAFFRSQLPDSTAQPRLRPAPKTALAPADTTAATYLFHPAYRYYPVVGITYEQARNYCRWRTATVRQLRQAPTGQAGRSPYYAKHRKQLAAYDISATYRLPTPAEWELAASRPVTPGATPEPTALADINSHAANPFGIRNLPGNVAELTANPAVVKGGSWFQPNVPPQANRPNPGPRPWLGFRCACEVEVRPKGAGY